MSDFASIARPYAQAAFELAQEQQQLSEWSDGLALLAAVVQDPQVQPLLLDPKRSRQQRAEIVLHICAEHLTPLLANLVRLLAENGRLPVIPMLATEFERLRAELESTATANIISAEQLPDAQLQSIQAALQQRLGKTVSLEVTIDPSLIGGAMIRVDDWVIDGSIKSHLQHLSATLSG